MGKVAGRRYAAISVDQAAARATAAETFLPSMEFGLSNHDDLFIPLWPMSRCPTKMTRGSCLTACSAVASQSFPTGSVARWPRTWPPSVLPHQPTITARVVDAVTDEAKTLRGKLGTADKQKLDQYLDSVRTLESRVERFEARCGWRRRT